MLQERIEPAWMDAFEAVLRRWRDVFPRDTMAAVQARLQRILGLDAEAFRRSVFSGRICATPSRAAVHKRSTPSPEAQTTPMPETTTRRPAPRPRETVIYCFSRSF